MSVSTTTAARNADSTISWTQDADGIVVLTLDDPTQSVNTMNTAFLASMSEVVDRLKSERETVAGVIVRSAKRTFFAGGDLRRLRDVTSRNADGLLTEVNALNRDLRELETLGRPVVATIAGSALGGGMEVALACQHRIVVNSREIKLGLPEVTFGLMPGAGGVVRTVRMLGLDVALNQVLLDGRSHSVARALEIGLVDDVVDDERDLDDAARRWIAEHPDATQPWDAPGAVVPRANSHQAVLPTLTPRLRKKSSGDNYPALRSIQAAAVEGALVDFRTAILIESRYFVHCVTSRVAKNMIQARFFDMQFVRAVRSPRLPDAHPVEKVVVLGAGMMGAGIAYVFAEAGVDVVLKDVSLAAAERGKTRSAKALASKVSGGTLTNAEAETMLARIVPSAQPSDAHGADLVIEAVFEDAALKGNVLSEIGPFIGADALMASNTSTLPISDLARTVEKPQDFIGLHFFSPVDKMPLLEVIRGQQTSDMALERTLAVARLLGKVPIVVNDSRGFFTSRVIGRFLDEGISMIAEGIAPASIEHASLQAGFPSGVLQLSDELNLDLLRRVKLERRAETEALGIPWLAHPADAVVDWMLDQHARGGRQAGAGFYDYNDGRRVSLWPGLEHYSHSNDLRTPLVDMIERLLFIQSIEAVKCLDENVVTRVADANVGSLLGIGFPAWTGGVLQFINGYEGGVAGFVSRASDLAERFGGRFEPPASLVARAVRGDGYLDEQASASRGAENQ